MSGPSIVQTTGQPTASSGAVAFTLGAAPTAGNVLIAECSWNPGGAARGITTPSGWHLIHTANQGGNQAISTFWRAVQAGDSASWSFTVTTTGGNDYTSGAIYEITGASTTYPVNVWQAATYAAAANSFATPSVAPTLVGCLALACWTLNNNALTTTFSGVSSGWSEDVTEASAYHQTFAAHQTVNTTDTTTLISSTLTIGAAETDVGASQILLIGSTPPPSPYVVQDAGTAAGPVSSVTLTLPVAPTAGNLLTAFIGYNAGGGIRSITPPSGSWTTIDDTGPSSNDSLATFSYVAQSGDPASWTFTIATTGGSDWGSGVLYEIYGQSATSPVNAHNPRVQSGVNPFTTNSVTPSVIGCLAIAALTTDGGDTVSSVSSDWLIDQLAAGGYHSSYGAHKRLLTADTTTAISNVFTLGGADAGSTEILLIAPAAIAAGADNSPYLLAQATGFF